MIRAEHSERAGARTRPDHRLHPSPGGSQARGAAPRRRHFDGVARGVEHPALPRLVAAAARVCPYRVRTKGKVKGGVKYVKCNALAGHEFTNFAAHLLDTRPEWRGQICFVQISVPSREDVPESAELRTVSRCSSAVAQSRERLDVVYRERPAIVAPPRSTNDTQSPSLRKVGLVKLRQPLFLH